jgi:ubiquitin-conjugating enzyme E2 S
MIVNSDDLLDIQADIEGPSKSLILKLIAGTPYQGGIFRCVIFVEQDFPSKPPKGNLGFVKLSAYFTTKIFHPNISTKGEICVNHLKKDWNPCKWSFSLIFDVSKFIHPNRLLSAYFSNPSQKAL